VESRKAVDTACGAQVIWDRSVRWCCRLLFLGLVSLTAICVIAQDDPTARANELFQAEKWSEVVRLAETVPNRSPELDYEYGLALAHLERWDDASKALLAGRRLLPRDKRFPIELAGVAFKQKHYTEAIAWLHRALRLDPADEYANDFLASAYFLQGNLEAAVKYWEHVGKPRLAELHNEPPLRIRPSLLDHAVAFSSESTLRLDELLATRARLEQLEIFPTYRFDLAAREDGRFDSVLHAHELNGFGSGKLDTAVRLLRGLPFQEINPEYYNLGGGAMNVVSLLRWDAEKRRASAAISAPVFRSPQWRFRMSADLRNENWDVRNGFTGPAPVLASLNMRKEEAGAEITRLMGWRWRWSVGVDFSHRDYRNVVFGTALTPQLLGQGFEVRESASISYALLHSPEYRLTVATSGEAQAARLWSSPGQSFQNLQGSLEARWFPQSRGDDYETRWVMRGAKTFGQMPFDQLFMLGLERDNDLLLRAHIGTRGGRKGSAPLGQNFLLSNWETAKNLYSNGLITLKLGPFVDLGKITGPENTLGSEKWLVDTGAQTTLRVLGVGVVFVYGKDLRTGNNAFYTTISR
jgi:tetratricopeptide (TPR) repeat protein